MTLEGISVVEVRGGTGARGALIGVALPGLLLRSSGAAVTVLRTGSYLGTFDEVSGETGAWDDGKTVLDADPSSAAFRAAVAAADVVLLAGADLPADVRTDAAVLHVDAAPDDWELTVQARNGLMALVTGPDGGPTYSAVPMAGYGTALAVYCAALAALYRRVTGGGRLRYRVTMDEGLAATQSMVLRRVEHPTMPLDEARIGHWQFRCADGVWVHVNLVQTSHREAFRQVLAELGTDPPPVTEVAGDAADPLIREVLGRVPSERVLALLSTHQVPGQPAVPPREALSDGDFRAMGLVSTAPDGRAVIERAFLTEGGPATAAPPASGTGLPLSGVTVVDAGVYIAGPYGAFVLGRLGARVIKLESASGDPLRIMPDIFGFCNAGKESVSVDFRSAEGRAAVERIVRAADVVHHNIRPGTAARNGLDEQTCAQLNDSLVHSRVSAFGHLGPRAGDPGFDQTFQALSGVEVGFGGRAQPLWHPSAIGDVAAGWLGAAAVIEGLVHRARTGAGGTVHTPAVTSGLLAVSGLVSGELADPPLSGLGAGYRIHRCADGRWVACAVGAEAAQVLVDAGEPLESLVAARSADEVVVLVRKAGGAAELVRGSVTAPPLYWHGDAYCAVQFAALPAEDVLGFDDPELGHVEVPDYPGTWEIEGRTVRPAVVPPPARGEHTEAVLADPAC